MKILSKKFKKNKTFAVLFSTAAILVTSAYGSANAVPLEQAVKNALQNSYKVRIAEERVSESEFDLKRARSDYYPQIELVSEGGEEYNNPLAAKNGANISGGDHNHSYNASVIATQPLYDGSRTDKEVERRKSQIISNKIRATGDTEKVILETIEAYMEVYRSKTAYQLSMDNYNEVKRLHELVKKLVEGGSESKITSKYANVKMLSAESEVKRTKLDYNNAVNTFSTLVGIDIIESEIQIPEYTNQLLNASLKDLYSLAQKHNTKIARANTDFTTLDFERQGIVSNYRPRVDLQIKGQQSEDVGGDVGKDQNVSAMLRLNYSIFDGFENESREEKIKSRIKQQEYRILDLSREIKNDITSLKNRSGMLNEKIDILIEEIEDLKEYVKLNRLTYEKGRGNVMELIDANLDLYNKRKEFNTDYFELVNNLFELQQVTGILRKNLEIN